MSLLALILVILLVVLCWPLIKAYALIILLIAAVVYILNNVNRR